MTRAATSVMRYARFFTLAGVRKVLDYGAGLLRNSIYLAEQGFQVYAADLPEQIKALSLHPGSSRLAGLLSVRDLPQTELGVDLVLSTYVFNIIATREKRGQYLENVVLNLKPGGFFLIEVNRSSDETPCTSVLRHYPGCDGQRKSYCSDDLDRLLVPLNFRRICHYYSSHALAAVYRHG
ncbi:methyltransferase domain-containing protein [Geomonas terrae]|uniref:Methyltransferase domain-containing protein n=1 Tax=Geomonas terrae TaxID=2562681 RepID=A0A4S1CDI0_9BACT|nr:methyltransferase domain-containing protein [Geomonas terrae]TGU71469.1 methyltransferase domain-containing protein [Geomonas terrae]